LIDTLSCNIFTIDQTSPYTEHLISIHTIDPDFFLTFTDKTYKVTSEGIVSEVSDDILLRLIKVQNAIYGISYDALYKSVDEGNSWEKLFKVASFMNDLHYQVINNEVVGFYYSQLFKIDFEKNEIREIMNDGLEGHRITSISKFKDKVFVTTFSGVFYKEWEDFYNFKEIESK